MTLLSVYQSLFERYGAQHWWPADSAFEVMVGAVLTQNTAWSNVEKALGNLKQAKVLSADRIAASPQTELAQLIRPAGYFNVKAKRLHNFCHWFLQQGGIKKLQGWDDKSLRHGLLSVNGIGPETADDMVLYAFHRPVFVIDAYTRRIFSRLGLIKGEESYESLRHLFESELGKQIKQRDEQVSVYNEYHALIVLHAKDVCRKKPRCDECSLKRQCAAVQS